MKQYILSVLLLFIFYSFTPKQNMDKNPVLLKSINKTYEGKTKKGLAHGKGKAFGEKDRFEGYFKKGYPHGQGTYIWGNGNKYTGQFSKGKMNGKGELIIKHSNGLPDEIKTGYFKNNEYIGKYKDSYKIISESGIRNIDFNKKGGQLNQLSFEVYSNGQRVSGLTIQEKNNTKIDNIGGYQTMTNINFPLERVEVSFSSNGINYNLIFDLYEKGNWQVVITV